MKVDRAAGLAVVIALHGAALYGLWSHRLPPAPAEAAAVYVNFITPLQPPPLQKEPPRAEPPKPMKPEKPRPVEEPHHHLVAEAPVLSPAEPVAPPSPVLPAPVAIAPPAPPPALLPAGPVSLASDLSLTCPQRTPPTYPALSRRLGEEGKVVLRVELDTDGRVDSARVITSSGFKRLDGAALSAVGGWRCNPPLHDGQPVRAVALQPFQFNLE